MSRRARGGILPAGAGAWWMFCVAACVKLLLIPAYRSTDFDVHLNWLNLTSTFPLRLWYSDDHTSTSSSSSSSQWTLDYPPFFAYFELLLSFLYKPFPFLSPLLFQRLSVLFSDLSLLLSSLHHSSHHDPNRRRLLYALVLWSPALIIVDHVHFQYNGFLLGILLASLACLREGRDFAGGVWFAVLVCFKHLFAIAGPLYLVYLLRKCFVGDIGWRNGASRFTLISAAVVAVVAAAFGPFVYHGQMRQVLERLFPFGRGLCHAYWAPNFWVFYIVLDKVLALSLKKLGFDLRAPTASFTGGLVGDSPSFAVFPQVTPRVSLLLVLLAMSPCLVQAWKAPHPRKIVRWVAYAYTCGFMFGWHVHEKASLHFVIPLGVIAIESLEDARHYFLLAIVACYSMFPLLFEPQEYLVKVLLLIVHSMVMWSGFSSLFCEELASKKVGMKKHSLKSGEKGLIGWIGFLYLWGLFSVELWGQFLHSLVFGSRLPFLPLMLVSISCAVGMTYSWVWQLKKILEDN